MSPSLSVVTDNTPRAAPARETVAQRVRRLQGEARQAAHDHVATLTDALHQVEKIAAEIAQGGDVYGPGVRNVARLLVEESASRAETIKGILARAK